MLNRNWGFKLVSTIREVRKKEAQSALSIKVVINGTADYRIIVKTKIRISRQTYLLVKVWQNKIFLKFSVYLTNTSGHIRQTVKALRIFHNFTSFNEFYEYFHQVNYINYTKQSKLLYLTSSWFDQNSGITGIGGIMLTGFSIALFRLLNLVWDLTFQNKKFK